MVFYKGYSEVNTKTDVWLKKIGKVDCERGVKQSEVKQIVKNFSCAKVKDIKIESLSRPKL